MHEPIQESASSINTWKRDGYCSLNPSESPLTQDDITKINDLINLSSLERIQVRPDKKKGDHHSDCLFLVFPNAQGVPEKLDPLADKLLDIALSTKMTTLVQSYLANRKPLYCRRAQINELRKGDRVGAHKDCSADSEFSVTLIIHLNQQYSGGTLCIQHPTCNKPIEVPAAKGDVLLLDPRVNHYVSEVTDGFRRTLVLFLGHYEGATRKAPKRWTLRWLIGKVLKLKAQATSGPRNSSYAPVQR